MNLLSVDFGTKNIGLAWCDTGIGAVLPFGVIDNEQLAINNKQKKTSVDRLADLITKENINLVIVGLPISTNSRENKNTERVKKFADDLRKLISAPIEYFDERFSSQAADRMEGGVSRDEKSAMVILEDYLRGLKR
jgi:putative Holliday junction resolvase